MSQSKKEIAKIFMSFFSILYTKEVQTEYQYLNMSNKGIKYQRET